MREPNFAGRDGFYWFQGVVEDRQDPLQLGRVRVRILGWHLEDKNLIPTEELHWAYVMQPITSAAMNGVGETPLGPVPGTWVVGFFRDGSNGQEPIIIGTLGGIPLSSADSAVGFNDPRDNGKETEALEDAPTTIKTRTYHKDGTGVTLEENDPESFPRENYLQEPDTNRLARGEESDTIIETKKANVDTGVPVAFGITWNEPNTTYAAQYPYNHVKESESGHIEEVDDTPGAERTHRWHRTGTCEEIITDGTKVVKVVNDNYEILLKDNKIHIMGKNQETIDKDFDLYVKGRFNIQVDGNVNLLVKGDVLQKVLGNFNLKALQNISIEAGGNIGIKASGKVDIKNGGNGAWDASSLYFNSGSSNPSSPEEPKK